MLNVTDIKVNNGSLSIIIIMPHKLISAPQTGTGNLLSDMDKKNCGGDHCCAQR